ncbi:MAG: hypothetical protein ABEI52_09500, partial [Halobacteriaceae archaeon]
TVEFEDTIPLPIGTEVPHSTVTANPIIEVQGENIQIHDRTDRGWPTLVTYQYNEYSVGIAVDYLALHRQDVGMEEVDLLISYHDEEWSWQIVVAFSSQNEALERGHYKTDGYNGYELIPWNTDDRYEKMGDLMEDDITPIAYTEDHPEYPAHAMQSADNIGVLERMFDIDKLQTLERRQERLFTKVVPKEVRWDDKDTGLQDLARDILDDSNETQ